MQVRSLGQEGFLEMEMAIHSSILAWEILWTEEPGRLYSPWGPKEFWAHLIDCTTAITLVITSQPLISIPSQTLFYSLSLFARWFLWLHFIIILSWPKFCSGFTIRWYGKPEWTFWPASTLPKTIDWIFCVFCSTYLCQVQQYIFSVF